MNKWFVRILFGVLFAVIIIWKLIQTTQEKISFMYADF